MVVPSRYLVSDETAGISKGILINKLGIKNQKGLDNAETILLTDAYSHFFELLKNSKVKFNLALLFEIHRYFLGHLYDWAGKVRAVNISKDDMFFVPVKFLDNALIEFSGILRRELLISTNDKSVLSKKLAIIHNEFNAIHPFREGNGRTIRLFLDLLAVNFGYDPIGWGKEPKTVYFDACIKGVNGEHGAVAKLIKGGLKKAVGKRSVEIPSDAYLKVFKR